MMKNYGWDDNNETMGRRREVRLGEKAQETRTSLGQLYVLFILFLITYTFLGTR